MPEAVQYRKMLGSMSTVKFERSPFPYVYEIELTNVCPYRCIMCPRGRGEMTRQVGYMSIELLKQILSQVSKEQRLLRLHHFGESVLHPKIGECIWLVRQEGFIPVLSLNPASLTESEVDEIIDSGVGIVCFSMDSLNTERLKMIRGIDCSAEYCLNIIDYFIHRSRRSGHPIFKVIQMVSLSINRDEHEEFLELKKRYPEEDVYVYISLNYGFGDIGLVAETDKDSAVEVLANRHICSAPFNDVVVLWNGDVVLCCYDFNGENIIGNLREQKLNEIWIGHKAEHIRSLFVSGDTDRLVLCKKCYLAPHKDENKDGTLKRGIDEERYILSLTDLFHPEE